MKILNFFSQVIAMEYNPVLALICKDRGIDTIHGRMSHIPYLQKKIDVITAFEVLEHVVSPMDFLTECCAMLFTYGILVLTCPNFESFELSVLHEDSDSVDAEHMNYLNPESIKELLRNTGFDVLEISTPGVLDCELVKSKKDKVEWKGSFPELIFDKRNIEESFQKFLSDNLLSSHMQIIARKK
jgi:SAM-dependent methyltransferase